MDYLINHKRFKKKFDQNELIKHSADKKKIIKFPHYDKNYHNFFSSYEKKNYKLVKNNCLCGGKNDILLSQTDRYCVEFVTVVCKDCGLIRAKDYFRNEDVEDFYRNFYRTDAYSENYQLQTSPANMFDTQKKIMKFRYDLLEKYKIEPINNLKIVDLGGGVGGILDHFNESNKKYLFDYFDPYLKYAETKGIKSTKGGLDKIDFKPIKHLIILSFPVLTQLKKVGVKVIF